MNPILQRLDEVAIACFGSRPNLARAIGKRPDALNPYFHKDSIPGGEFLAALREQGISADWLLSGEGSMYADNTAGRRLRNKQSLDEPIVLGNASHLLQQKLVTPEELAALKSLIQKVETTTSTDEGKKGSKRQG